MVLSVGGQNTKVCVCYLSIFCLLDKCSCFCFCLWQTFRRLLLSKCQEEFENRTRASAGMLSGLCGNVWVFEPAIADFTKLNSLHYCVRVSVGMIFYCFAAASVDLGRARRECWGLSFEWRTRVEAQYALTLRLLFAQHLTSKMALHRKRKMHWRSQRGRCSETYALLVRAVFFAVGSF